MSRLDDLQQEPWRFDIFDLLRRIERSMPGRPRLGDGATRRDETFDLGGGPVALSLGQDPFLDFPASNVARATYDATQGHKRLALAVKFLGLLGPQGALPTSTTEEAFHYFVMQDDAYARFLDLFNQRFLLLFFRVWSDARPIAQHDRPDRDRFLAYLGSVAGIGSPPFRELDRIPDLAKAGLAGLLGPQVKSASRLCSAIRHVFGIRAEIEEFVGSWLPFDASERSTLGGANSGLGTSLVIGDAFYSVESKIRIRLYVSDMTEYQHLLPTGEWSRRLVDLVFFYVGETLDWEVELALPTPLAKPATLGRQGALGWTSWLAPAGDDPRPYRCDARFNPAERAARERRAA